MKGAAGEVSEEIFVGNDLPVCAQFLESVDGRSLPSCLRRGQTVVKTRHSCGLMAQTRSPRSLVHRGMRAAFESDLRSLSANVPRRHCTGEKNPAVIAATLSSRFCRLDALENHGAAGSVQDENDTVFHACADRISGRSGGRVQPPAVGADGMRVQCRRSSASPNQDHVAVQCPASVQPLCLPDYPSASPASSPLAGGAGSRRSHIVSTAAKVTIAFHK